MLAACAIILFIRGKKRLRSIITDVKTLFEMDFQSCALPFQKLFGRCCSRGPRLFPFQKKNSSVVDPGGSSSSAVDPDLEEHQALVSPHVITSNDEDKRQANLDRRPQVSKEQEMIPLSTAASESILFD